MGQITLDTVYRLWEYTSQMDWEGVRSALQNDDVWDEFGDEEGEVLMSVLDEIEREELTFPENAEELYSVLSHYTS
jgi:hypothetical protein